MTRTQTAPAAKTSANGRGYMPPSKTDNHPTPQALFDRLHKEFKFTCDAAASAENAKCDLFFNRRQNGLSQNWGKHVVFLNPPYGRCIAEWANKALEASRKGATVVMLVPARTDTAWFHDVALSPRAQVRFVRGRIKFGSAMNAAPFPNVVVVLHPPHVRRLGPKVRSMKAI
jgi:phage N-6-adenine-methyltransferase